MPARTCRLRRMVATRRCRFVMAVLAARRRGARRDSRRGLVRRDGSAQAYSGRYVLRHSDDFAGGKAHFQPMLELADGELLELDYGPRRAPDVPPGASVRVTGARQGNTVHRRRRWHGGDGQLDHAGGGHDDEARRRRPLHLLERPQRSRTRRRRATGVAFTNSELRLRLLRRQHVGAAWPSRATSSAGTRSRTPTPSCSYSTWANQANQRGSGRAGSTSAPTSNVVYAFPSTSSCGWSGLAIPAREVLVAQRRGRDEPARHGARARPQLRHAPREHAAAAPRAAFASRSPRRPRTARRASTATRSP